MLSNWGHFPKWNLFFRHQSNAAQKGGFLSRWKERKHEKEAKKAPMVIPKSRPLFIIWASLHISPFVFVLISQYTTPIGSISVEMFVWVFTVCLIFSLFDYFTVVWFNFLKLYRIARSSNPCWQYRGLCCQGWAWMMWGYGSKWELRFYPLVFGQQSWVVLLTPCVWPTELILGYFVS